MKKRVLLFDIDMTMIRTVGAGRSAMECAFEQEFGIASATEGIFFDGRTDRGIFVECLDRHALGGGSLAGNMARFMERYLEELPASLKAKGGLLLPGVTDLLAALSETDAVVGLATGNLRRGAQLKLEHFGIWDRFAGGGFGDDHIIRGDLVLAGIAEMAALHGCEAGDCDVIVLGDTPLDVEAAHFAGARALGVGTGRFTPAQLLDSGAEFALPDLSETEQLMQLLLHG